jgi:hypothetical protein
MKYQETIDALLREACPSIQYRIRREILDQSSLDDALSRLQPLILEDDLVKTVLSWQKADGWLARDFHGFESIETGIRILAEKGVSRDHPVFSKALDALARGDDRLHLGIGKVGKILDKLGFGGSQRIRATIFAYAGIEGNPQITQEIESALQCFQTVRKIESIADITEKYGERLVFRPGVLWPDIYALRLLAFTEGWRNPKNLRILQDAIARIVKLSPIPEVYIRFKSQWMAPGSFAMSDFNSDMKTLDDAGWMKWFHRNEMLSRLGLVQSNPNLRGQAAYLKNELDENGGWFTRPLSHYTFNKWGAYSGLRLERDWRSPKRRRYDLTFRSLLILHYSNKPANLSPDSIPRRA